MAFKIPTKNTSMPKSTIDLFNKLGKIERLSLQQGESLQEYEKLSGKKTDIAIEMPAGHGKTLVGGLIAEFSRIKKEKRVVYCCATKQLAAQTNQLLNSYGIKSVLLINKRKDFSEKDFGLYQKSKAVAVTTYSHIFNTNSAFKDSNTIIFDDAHATEYSINDFWTLEINKNDKTKKNVFNSLYAIIKDITPKHTRDKIDFDTFDSLDSVDIVPQPLWLERLEDIKECLNVNATKENKLIYPWIMIKDYLHACQLYISQDTIAIKPVIAPNLYQDAFINAQERIYMSATLGALGELEKVFGIQDILRISKFPKGMNKVSGRRLLLFPEDHFEKNDVPSVLLETIKMQPRALMLFPSKKILNEYKVFLEENLPEYRIFLNEDVEESLEVFKGCDKGVLLLAGRYEGIDLKDDECRLQIIVDLPVAVGVSEKFLQTTLRVTEILKERLATRLVQGLGRCTRGNKDFAAVLFLGKSVGEYLYKNDFRKLLPPEIDAELEFGFEQIDNINDLENWKESLSLFFNQSEDWENVEKYITSVTDEKQKHREENGKNGTIELCANHEIKFQYSLMEKKFEQSNISASTILETLGRDPIYKGYRAWWNYSKACIYNQIGDNEKTQKHLTNAISASTNKLWIENEILKFSLAEEIFYGEELEFQLNEILKKLSSYGDRDKRFEKDWDKIIQGLKNKNAEIFESSLKEYGVFLGFQTTKPIGKGTPDGIWDILNYSLVFEAKTNIEDETASIPLDDIRQAGFHEKWVLENHNASEKTKIYVFMICEKKFIEDYAKHAAEDIFLVSPTDFFEKAEIYGNILRETMQKLKNLNEEEAKHYLAKKLMEINLSIKEFVTWLATVELKATSKN